MGRDSILLRLISRKANTLSDLKSAPGVFFTLNTIEVLFGAARNQPVIVGGFPAFSGAPARGLAQLSNQKKAREVALVVFDTRLKNVAQMYSRAACLPGDSRRILQFLRDHVLHAARRIVERHCLNLRMTLKKVAALVERHRMRQHSPQRAQPHAGHGDHVVNNPQQDIPPE